MAPAASLNLLESIRWLYFTQRRTFFSSLKETNTNALRPCYRLGSIITMDVKACFAIDVKPCDILGLVLRHGHPTIKVVGKERGDEDLHHHHTRALSRTPPAAFSKWHETERADIVVRMMKESSRVKLVQRSHVISYPFVPALLVLMQSMYAGDYSRSGLDLVLPATNSQIKVFNRGIVDQRPWRLVTQCFMDGCVQLWRV